MGDRDAFMRMMGITNDDIASPDSAPLAGARAGKHQSTMSSMNSSVGLSYCSENTSGLAATTRSSGSDGSSVAPMPQASSNNSAMSAKRRAFLAELGLDENGNQLNAPPSAQPSPSVLRGGATAANPKVNTGSCRTPADFKAAGNTAFEEGAFLEAIKHYTQAIDLAVAASERRGGGGEDSQMLAALYSNRSASYLQAAKQWSSAESAYEHALSDADHAIELRPEWFKGYSRQGDAYFKSQHYHQAAEAFEMALRMQPGNANLTRSLQESQERAKRSSREEWQARRQARKNENSSSSLAHSQSSNSGAFVGNPTSRLGRDFEKSAATRGNSRAMWEELKAEVGAAQPTGDDYRRLELERYRQQREEKSKRLFGTAATGTTTTATSSSVPSESPTPVRHSSSNNAPANASSSSSYNNAQQHRGSSSSQQDIPYEYSSSAASAYQSRLLEEYRRKKASKK